MSKSNLSYSKLESGLEVVILNDGSAWVTQSSYARFVGFSRQAIFKRSQGLNVVEMSDISMSTKVDTGLIKTQINTGEQLHTVVLIPAKIFGCWLIKDNPELGMEMIEAGATQFLYKLSGYSVGVVSEPIKPELPPVDIRITQFVSTLEKLGVDLLNPRHNQLLKDFVLDKLLGESNQPALEPGDKWCGVVERAEQLGYPVKAVVQYRSALGNYVARRSGNIEFKLEERLCNGTHRPIKLYKISGQFDNLINTYMTAKGVTK